MLDDFRQQANETSFDDEELPASIPLETRTKHQFLGMSPGQRLLIALMLLIITCLLSTFCLLVTEKVVLPFM